MTSDEKMKHILQSAAVPKDTKKMLEDMNGRRLMYGSFTIKQSELIEKLYQNISQQKELGEVKPKKYALGQIQSKDEAQCWDCADSGFIRLTRKEVYEPLAKFESGSAPCHCDRGRAVISAALRKSPPLDLGPQFNELWLKSYEICPEYTEKSGIFSRDLGDARETNREPDPGLPSL